MSDELLLERVRTQPIVRFKFNHGGSSISFRVEFADGSRAAWKPTQTNTQTIPRKELAAYRLNRLLGPQRRSAGGAARRVARRAPLAPPPGEPGVSPPHQGRDDLQPERDQLRDGVVLDPGHQGLGVRHARRPEAEHGLADRRGRANPARADGVRRPDLRPHPVRLPDLQPRPLLGGQHEDVARRDASSSTWTTRCRSSSIPNGTEKNREVLVRTQRFSRTLYEALDRVTVPTLQRALAQEAGARLRHPDARPRLRRWSPGARSSSSTSGS